MINRLRRRSIRHKLDRLVDTGHRYHLKRSVGDLRIVILSDMHKGTGADEADDFRGAADTYVQSLRHYFDDGYELVVLGDGEELWETSWSRVHEAYARVYAEERRYLEAGRYWRIYGNHDLAWQTADRVQADLQSALPGVDVFEAIDIAVDDEGSALGTLLLVHGHQGTILSDYFAPVARLAVRHLWANVQRVLRAEQPAPSNDYELLRAHDMAMRDWAAARPGTVLISGHTHRAIFHAPEVDTWLQEELAAACAVGDRGRAEALVTVNKKVSGLKPRRLPGTDSTEKPCYFNSGCCLARPDRHLDAIELADGQIRLVKWCEGDRAPRRARHRTADLRAVLAACGETHGRSQWADG